MRAGITIVAALMLCGAGAASAEENAQTSTQEQPKATEAKPEEAKAVEPKQVEQTQPAPTASAPADAAEPSAEPVHVDEAEAHKAPVAQVAGRGPFQTSWQEASADEKALYLESFGESSKVVQERWDKATPEQRQKILRAHPLIGARPLKHRWASATPEERAAFLEATARTAQKVKEAWESATPEQRKMLALEHPYFARKAFHHGWMEATPQEKIAFLAAHPGLQAELKARWTGASVAQRQWYAKNYPGLESKSWADISTEERALFLEANPAIAAKAREAWQKTQPEMRAAVARKWAGWPLRAYQAKLEATKVVAIAKARPASTASKAPVTAAKK